MTLWKITCILMKTIYNVSNIHGTMLYSCNLQLLVVTGNREQCLHLHLPVLTAMRNADYHNTPLLSAQLLVPYMVLLVPCFRFLCASHRCVHPPTLCPRPLQSHPHAGSFGRHRVFGGAQCDGLLPPGGGVQRLTADCCRSYR